VQTKSKKDPGKERPTWSTQKGARLIGIRRQSLLQHQRLGEGSVHLVGEKRGKRRAYPRDGEQKGIETEKTSCSKRNVSSRDTTSTSSRKISGLAGSPLTR